MHVCRADILCRESWSGCTARSEKRAVAQSRTSRGWGYVKCLNGWERLSTVSSCQAEGGRSLYTETGWPPAGGVHLFPLTVYLQPLPWLHPHLRHSRQFPSLPVPCQSLCSRVLFLRPLRLLVLSGRGRLPANSQTLL